MRDVNLRSRYVARNMCTFTRKQSHWDRLLGGSTHCTTLEFHFHLTIDTFLRVSFFFISHRWHILSYTIFFSSHPWHNILSKLHFISQWLKPWLSLEWATFSITIEFHFHLIVHIVWAPFVSTLLSNNFLLLHLHHETVAYSCLHPIPPQLMVILSCPALG